MIDLLAGHYVAAVDRLQPTTRVIPPIDM